MRKFLLLIFLLMTIPGTLYAQDDDSSAPVNALLWGADYFPYPDWQVSLTATRDQISSSWIREGETPAVVFYNQQFGFEQYFGEDLSKFVDEAWLDVIMEGYDSWEEHNRCLSKAVLTVEIDTEFDGIPYIARYWAFSEEEVFGSVFAAYQREQSAQLEAMAEHFFPDNAVCPSGG